jgi:hypothetical protein
MRRVRAWRKRLDAKGPHRVPAAPGAKLLNGQTREITSHLAFIFFARAPRERPERSRAAKLAGVRTCETVSARPAPGSGAAQPDEQAVAPAAGRRRRSGGGVEGRGPRDAFGAVHISGNMGELAADAFDRVAAEG